MLRLAKYRLDRVFRTRAKSKATDRPTSASPAALAGAHAPEVRQIPPTAPLPAVKATGPCIFVLVKTSGSHAATASSFVTLCTQALFDQGNCIRLVAWNSDLRKFRLLNRDELGGLSLSHRLTALPTCGVGAGDAQIVIERSSCGPDDWLLVAEPALATPNKPYLVEMDQIMVAKRLGLRTAFIFHGAELLRAKNYAGHVAKAHEQYMQALLLADAIMPVSDLAANDLMAFFVQHQKADRIPPTNVISVPVKESDAREDWSDYVRRLRSVLTDAADASRSLTCLYYLIDPDALSDAAMGVFARWLALALTERGIGLVPVVWDAESKKLIAAEGDDLQRWFDIRSPKLWSPWVDPDQADAPRWVFDPCGFNAELLREAAAFAKSRGLRVAAILYEGARETAQDAVYFEVFAGVDKVLVASEPRLRDFYRFLLGWRGKVHSAEHRFKVIAFPNEVPGQLRRVRAKLSAPGIVRILVIISDERPTDLRIMLDAAEAATRQSADQLIFTLIGRSPDVTTLRERIHAMKITLVPVPFWENEPERDDLNQLFDEADFIIFAGFDGPFAPQVVASLWRGLPCLVHGDGPHFGQRPVPGRAFANMEDASQLAAAILKLADNGWRRCLANEANALPVRSWEAYARDVAVELATDRLTDCLRPIEMSLREDVYRTLINLHRRPKLSLCISTYNRADWLDLNLRNIFTQIGKPRNDLEILVVDNASADHTPKVVKPFLGRPDFQYVRNPENVGMLGNLAVTAQSAAGAHVWILGDDDLTRPGVIERVLQIVDQHPDIALIYLNYGYTSEHDPGNVGDLKTFLSSYNMLELPGPDELGPVIRLAAKTENFFSAIYSHVYRRDHALKSYCQDTSGRIFSSMLSCIPTSYYVLNYMTNELAYWIGEPSLVVNSNVSWSDYGTLLDLEQLPRAWDLAERLGADPAEVDRRRANRLWLVELMWKEIFENDKAGNGAYFSAERVLMRLKHLKEFRERSGEFAAVYERAYSAGHPAAILPVRELFGAFL